NCAFIAGNREAGTPKYTFGTSVLGKFGPLDMGVTAKRTGPRFFFDTNRPVLAGDVDAEADITQLYEAAADAYWLVNLDVRFNLDQIVEKTYVQLNVYNLFDETYVGGFGGGLNQSVSGSGFYGSAPFVQIGAPRTVSASLSVSF
ncbi:MAG: TonB-dependent receptor, partial [Pseudomonadota bacterium]|nr:TonB-dependent receptor [Pseudomonadota bacterium]